MLVEVSRDLLALLQAFAGAREALLGQGWVRVWVPDRGDSSCLLAICASCAACTHEALQGWGRGRVWPQDRRDPPCVLAEMPPALHALMLALQGASPFVTPYVRVSSQGFQCC